MKENLNEKIEEPLDFEFLKEKLEKSSPKAIEKIKMMMKDPSTWMGIACLVAGSVGIYEGMSGQHEVKENIEELQSQAEGINAIYQQLKVMGMLLASGGIFLTVKAFQDMKMKLKAEEEEEEE